MQHCRQHARSGLHTLVIHWLRCLTVRRGRVAGVDVSSALVLGKGLLHARRRRGRVLSRTVANRRELNGPRTRICGGWLGTVGDGGIRRALRSSGGGGSLALALFFRLPLSFLLLLARLPLFTYFLEFYEAHKLVISRDMPLLLNTNRPVRPSASPRERNAKGNQKSGNQNKRALVRH